MMTLINYRFYRVEYLSAFDTMYIIFKGRVSKDHIIKLRNLLDGLSESLKIKKLILDFKDCDQANIDYNSHARRIFWEHLKSNGLSNTLLVIHPKSFNENGLSSWKQFYRHNKLNIGVSAISDRNLMPYFILYDS